MKRILLLSAFFPLLLSCSGSGHNSEAGQAVDTAQMPTLVPDTTGSAMPVVPVDTAHSDMPVVRPPDSVQPR